MSSREERDRNGDEVTAFDVCLYDLDGGYCPPGLSAPVGGSEVELHQLARMFQSAGLQTALVLGRNAVHYVKARTLIYWRQVEDVPWCEHAHAIVRATDDPQRHFTQARSLRTVCVSAWQAEKFWSPTIVIPPPLGAHVYSAKHEPVAGRWIYASAANKGIKDTLEAWRAKPRGSELVVTTTGYDEPDDGLCKAYGATWLGRLSPLRMVEEISRCEGMFYRNRAPETFGVSTAIAVALGLDLDVECVHDGGPCGLGESSRVGADLSEETIMKRWREILK